MNELKAHNINDLSLHDIANCEFYIKSESDKVISEFEERHKMEVEQLLMEIAELKAKNAQAEDDVAFWKAKVKGEM
jgi:hypothetical protein